MKKINYIFALLLLISVDAFSQNITALDFDGNDSYKVADVSNKLDVQTEYTIETWFNIRSHSTSSSPTWFPVLLDRRIVFSLYVIDDINASADYALRFVTRSSSNDNIRGSLRTDNSSATLNYNSWHHVAISRDAGTTRMFIDGNLIDSDSEPNLNFKLNWTANELYIGARKYSSYERYLNGKLDGISISKVGKYTSNFVPDILVNYPVDANTVLAMNLDEGVGTSIGDAAGNFTGIAFGSNSNYQPSWVSEAYVPKLFTWDGNTDSNWDNTNNWNTTSNMALPRSGDNIIINYSPTSGHQPAFPSETYTYHKIDIKTANTFILNPGSNITVADFENSGSFQLKSDDTGTGSLIATTSFSGSGTYNIQRYLNVPVKWQLVSPPTSGDVSGVFLGHYLKEWSPITGEFTAITATNTTITPGEGYVAKIEATGNNPIEFITIPDQSSIVNIPLSTTIEEPNGGAPVSNTHFDLPIGFHLVGNPYTSNLDWNTVYNYGSNSSNITEYLYFYVDGGAVSDPDHNPTPVKEGWQVYKAGTASSDSLIALGQGFGVVMVDNTSAKTFTIPSSAKTHETVANVFHKKNDTKENYLEINAVSNNIIDKATLQFNENATSNYDSEFDAYKIKSFSNSPVVSFIGDDLQKLAVSETPSVESIDLGFTMGEPGDVTLSLSNVKDLYIITLEDKLKYEFVDISSSSYSFYYTDETTDDGRFTLHFNKRALNNREEQTDFKIYSNRNTVYIKSNNELANVSVDIFNLSGQKVFSRNYQSLSTKEIQTNFNGGVYIVKITSNNYSQTERIMVKH